MPRYIDADKIPYFHYSDEDTAVEGVDYTLKGVIESRVPTENVAPVKHGYWKPIYCKKRVIWYECSECGCSISNGAYPCVTDYEFCPYCGTKMDMDGEPDDP